MADKIPVGRRWPRGLVAGLLGGLLVAGACTGGGEAEQPAGAPLPADTFGMRTNPGLFDLGEWEAAEAWLGRPIHFTVQFTGRGTPQQMNGSAFGLLGNEKATLDEVAGRVTLSLSIPLAFDGERGSGDDSLAGAQGLAATAAGTHDKAFQRVARRLIEAGHGDAILRLGHEFNGLWPPWSAVGNEEEFIAAWRHVRQVFLAESPDFRFDWTTMRARWAETAPPAWPGAEYVDYVGLDIYWRADGEGWNQQRWEREYLPNLEAHLAFAIEQGKPVTFPEWGLEGGDVPEYIDAMVDWFEALPPTGSPGAMAYHAYFNGRGEFSLDNYPRSKEVFRQRFGADG